MSRVTCFFTTLCLVFIITGCTEKPVLIVQSGQGDQSVTVKAGTAFTIQLKGRMSTGYSWKLVEIPAQFEIIKENVKTQEKDLAGGEDIQEFILKASGTKGDFNLTFRYAEHWKKRPKYVKTTTVKVRVE